MNKTRLTKGITVRPGTNSSINRFCYKRKSNTWKQTEAHSNKKITLMFIHKIKACMRNRFKLNFCCRKFTLHLVNYNTV